MNLLEQLDSAFLAALDDIPRADLHTYICHAGLLALAYQRRDIIEAWAKEADQEARAEQEAATRAAE